MVQRKNPLARRKNEKVVEIHSGDSYRGTFTFARDACRAEQHVRRRVDGHFDI